MAHHSTNLVVTKSVPLDSARPVGPGNPMVPVAGYLRGPGRRSILTMHREIEACYRRDAQRMIAGRRPLIRHMPDKHSALPLHRNHPLRKAERADKMAAE